MDCKFQPCKGSILVTQWTNKPKPRRGEMFNIFLAREIYEEEESIISIFEIIR